MSYGQYCRFCGAPDLLERIQELERLNENLTEELVYARARIASLATAYDNLKMERYDVTR
jgi:hypothetical protein